MFGCDAACALSSREDVAFELSAALFCDDEFWLDADELLGRCGAGAGGCDDEAELELELEDESLDDAAFTIAAKLVSEDCCEASERVDLEDAAWKAVLAKISDVTLTTLEPLAIDRSIEFSKERAKRYDFEISLYFSALRNGGQAGGVPAALPFLPGGQDLPFTPAGCVIASREWRLY